MIEVRGIFPIWVASEAVSTDEGFAGVSWFKEIDPPFRRGRGVWLRFGHRALHLGVQHRTRAQSDLDVLGRETETDGTIIGGWRDGSEVPQEDH